MKTFREFLKSRQLTEAHKLNLNNQADVQALQAHFPGVNLKNASQIKAVLQSMWNDLHKDNIEAQQSNLASRFAQGLMMPDNPPTPEDQGRSSASHTVGQYGQSNMNPDEVGAAWDQNDPRGGTTRRPKN